MVDSCYDFLRFHIAGSIVVGTNEKNARMLAAAADHQFVKWLIIRKVASYHNTLVLDGMKQVKGIVLACHTDVLWGGDFSLRFPTKRDQIASGHIVIEI